MSEEFFEALKKRALDISIPFFDPWIGGMDATIEALKEMMVGEPQRGIIRHRPWFQNTGLSTDIDTPDPPCQDGMIPWSLEKHGTDGEEVEVLVVRCGES